MKLNTYITVAIDSPAAAGAGTQSKLIAKHYNLNYLDTKLDLQLHKYKWSEQPAITCPVDKFMGYACQTDLLDLFLYPVIDINKSVASNSDIGLSEGINAWHFGYDAIIHYSKLLGDIK